MFADLFRFFMTLKPVRYFITAGLATIVDVFVYYLMLNLVLKQKPVVLESYVLRATSIALVTSYGSGLMTNFTLTKFFVFTESELKTRFQLVRFILVAGIVLVANYFFMHFLINTLCWYPTPSRAFSAITIGLFSFMAHRHFSFKI